MGTIDLIVIVLYFAGLVGVSLLMSRRIKNSEDMFIAGRNSSWWLSGVSSYMTIFSASTFVVWGGVAYKSGLVAVMTAIMLGFSSLIVSRWIAGRWRRLRIKSPGEYLTVRFGHRTLSFYTVAGIVGRGMHTAVALYAVAVVTCALIQVPDGSILASTGLPGDSAAGNLSIWWALAILGGITLAYTIAGGFLAVLMTDFVQFGVLLSVVVFMVPLSLHAVGGPAAFLEKAGAIPGFFSPTSPTYSWIWLVLWMCLHVAMIGGDWPFVQRYISVPTVTDARKSTALIGVLYLLTPLIWYLPAMAYRTLVPGPGMDVDPAAMTQLGEGAYVSMSKTVLMTGMVGMMLAAMLSATLSNVSGTLNVYANVYTYEIWGRRKRHEGATERERIRAGRLFTLIFGLIIIGIAMLVPLAGGAEKVVVMVITMVLCPLYIPSIWGLFSKRLNGNRLMLAMLISWAAGFTARFTIPAEVLSPSLIESLSGFAVPVLILGAMELWCKAHGIRCEGSAALEKHVDPNAEKEPTEDARIATRKYSYLAINCFCITLAAIAVLLVVLLLSGDPRTLEVKRIVLGFLAAISALIFAYIIYRIVKR